MCVVAITFSAAYRVRVTHIERTVLLVSRLSVVADEVLSKCTNVGYVNSVSGCKSVCGGLDGYNRAIINSSHNSHLLSAVEIDRVVRNVELALDTERSVVCIDCTSVAVFGSSIARHGNAVKC